MHHYDYAQYNTCPKTVPPEVNEITWPQYLQERKGTLILDVRPANLYRIVHLQNSKNIPYELLATMSKEQVAHLLGS
jgi:rhodanese-related sulfurtransferase